MTTFFDIYLKIKPGDYLGDRIQIMHDSGDILPLSGNINAFVLCRDAEKVIVILRLEQANLEAFIENVPEGINPFSYEGAAAIGISNIYIGHTWEEVEAAFPDLTELKTITDIEGNTVMVAALQDVVIR